VEGSGTAVVANTICPVRVILSAIRRAQPRPHLLACVGSRASAARTIPETPKLAPQALEEYEGARPAVEVENQLG